jgi:hypothetical protein
MNIDAIRVMHSLSNRSSGTDGISPDKRACREQSAFSVSDKSPIHFLNIEGHRQPTPGSQPAEVQ